MAAAIWGLGFVAQRLGMDHMGPYTFNGLRFLLGAASLLPLLWWLKSRQPAGQSDDRRLLLTGGLLAGAVLFSAASLQQVGLLYTTAAKAGFITGLYIILVPVIGLALRHKTGTNTWVGALIAMAGLYYLSVTEDFTIGYGDLLQVAGALFWAIHLLVLDHYSSRVAPIRLASVQFLVCGLLSLAVAFTIEMPTISGAVAGWQALLYAGLVSVGVGYTLQVVGQRGAHPAHAAIILSLETVFAAIGGVLLLGEILDERAIVGCALMLAGMLISQVRLRWWWKSRKDRLPKQG
ncbi:permease [Aeromonas salmonicida subsp. pectinolytica 34mel]|nr:permease [Aeromonas salmonicida subsp. pectinolytica 34mel]